MAQQTAIEWLVNWSKENPLAFQSDYYEAIEQAKAMEKEQIIKAFNYGSWLVACKEIDSINYYNETYQNGKKD